MDQGDYKQDLVNGSNGFHPQDTGALAEAAARSTFQLTADAEAYIQHVEQEIASLGSHAPMVRALAERELARVKSGEISEQGYYSIHKDVPIKVIRKILIPNKECPTINFVGRLLGPKGGTLKALQHTTRSKILIFGRGSMWDKTKEDEARKSGDTKYAHLNEDLHVYVEITAYPAEVQSRFSHVVSELKKFLDPNNPGHFMAGDVGVGPPMRPPGPPGMRGPPPPGYRGPRPPMGGPVPPRAYGAPPRPAAPQAAPPTQPAYDTTGYYGASGGGESSYQSAPAPDSYGGYAAYQGQSDYSQAPAASGYETQAAQAQQYAAQQQQQQQYGGASQPPSYGAQPSSYGQPPQPPAYGQTAQPAYGQPQAASGYAAQASYGQQPVYAAAAASAPSYGGYPAATSAQARPQYAAPAAKKPRLSAPYGSY